MDLNHPDFLAPPSRIRQDSIGGPTEPPGVTGSDSHGRRLSVVESSLSPHLPASDFDLILSEKLAFLDASRHNSVTSPFLAQQFVNSGLFSRQNGTPFGKTAFDPFNLPTELQGGVGNISLRRPSYAAELFTRNSDHILSTAPTSSNNKNSLATIAAANSYTSNNARYEFAKLSAGFENFNLNSNLSEFQARRPSQIAAPSHTWSTNHLPNQYSVPNYPSLGENIAHPMFNSNAIYTQPGYGQPQYGALNQYAPQFNANISNPAAAAQNQHPAKLDDGLILWEQRLEALAELRALYNSVQAYYLDSDLATQILQQLNALHNHPAVQKLISFMKNLNSLSAAQKNLCLVANKNGKLDLLSYPANTNLNLQKDDLVIVDGDRGKDMVMILDPAVSLTMGILFNFLKKQEHLKSLTITDNAGKNTVKGDKNSADDNEFVVSLPTKQVLRLGVPKEVYRLSAKIQEEKNAFFTCFNKIQELGLGSVIELINVEYQSDYKKLIFYYFANFKRIDFRVLIKELFKVYKTRIWLCAVLPSSKRELYRSEVRSLSGWAPAAAQNSKPQSTKDTQKGIPPEYTVAGSYTVQTFKNMPAPTYFHLHNMLNLMANLCEDLQGSFYGFNAEIIDQ